MLLCPASCAACLAKLSLADTCCHPVVLQGDQYLVKWRGLGYSECTWETKEALKGDQVKMCCLSKRMISHHGAAHHGCRLLCMVRVGLPRPTTYRVALSACIRHPLWESPPARRCRPACPGDASPTSAAGRMAA